MDFKIDTKSTYTNITPLETLLDANMTEAIRQKWYELVEDGCQNLILDLQNCTDAQQNGINGLLQMHEDCYSNDRSFVIIGLNTSVTEQFKNTESTESLNIVPTLAEAIDLINMEILERDLFSEE
jgi:anti-anti-sigma regulatory factor